MAGVISSGNSKPTNLSISRSDETVTLDWGIPINLVDSDFSGRKITFIDVWWAFNASQDMAKKWQEVRNGSGHVIADKLWIRDLGTSARSHTQDFDRQSYYPVRSRKLNSVTGWVQVNGAEVKTTYSFRKPYPPMLADPEFDGDENKVSFDWEFLEDLWTADGYDHERHDVHWQISRKDNMTPWYRTETLLDEGIVASDSGTSTSPAVEYADSLAYNQWIDIHFRARARGLAGDSPEAHVLYTIAWPSKASIQGIKHDRGRGTVTVWMSVNANAYHPVDTVELQRLADTSVWTVSAAREVSDSSWSTVATSSDDQCSGLVDADASGATPTTGKYTWYRVKTTRCGYVQVSDPVRATALEQKSAVSNDNVKIHSATPQEDGTSIRVVLGWNWAGQDSNGTEVSWSRHADAWQSTTAPSSYDLDDTRRDAQSQVPNMDASATLVIRDLEEGVPYYIRARRYLDSPDGRAWSDKVCSAPEGSYPVSPKTEPLAVRLGCPQYARRGDGATLTWTYDSDADQRSWTLYRVWDETSGNETVEMREVVGYGDDQSGACTVAAEQMGSGDTASFVVAVSMGSEWAESERATLAIADPPELDADAASTLEAQPMSFSCSAASTNLDVVAKVISDGTSSGTPDGETVQAEGDVVWSERLQPAWAADSGGYAMEHTLPTGLPFVDGTRYRLVCTAVDRTTGFSSDAVVVPFAVDWDHKASPPDPGSEVVADVANRTARVHPIAPSNAAETDVYDLYRVSNDSTDLVAAGQSFGIDAVDRFAPYSRLLGLTYRIATRTADGDVQWADFEYEMPVGAMRLDWGDGEYVELPYNVSLQDSYEKNYESHRHMDGSVSGHWNPGFGKSGSYATDLIKIDDAEQVRKVREMATYPGPVFVRTPDGGAFEANVTLGVDTTYSSGAVGISLDVQAHSLSDSFRIAPDDFEPVEEE